MKEASLGEAVVDMAIVCSSCRVDEMEGGEKSGVSGSRERLPGMENVADKDGARKRAGGDLRKKAARARNRTCTPAVGKAGIKTVMVGVSKRWVVNRGSLILPLGKRSRVELLLATTTFSYTLEPRNQFAFSQSMIDAVTISPNCFSTKREFGDCEQLWAVTAES